MSDLDIFAAHALTGLLTQHDGADCLVWEGTSPEDRANLAAVAYAIAEAMLRQRKIMAADKPYKETT